jgi:hypothetical protein
MAPRKREQPLALRRKLSVGGKSIEKLLRYTLLY